LGGWLGGGSTEPEDGVGGTAVSGTGRNDGSVDAWIYNMLVN
jgi:hypothetical protein